MKKGGGGGREQQTTKQITNDNYGTAPRPIHIHESHRNNFGGHSHHSLRRSRRGRHRHRTRQVPETGGGVGGGGGGKAMTEETASTHYSHYSYAQTSMRYAHLANHTRRLSGDFGHCNGCSKRAMCSRQKKSHSRAAPPSFGATESAVIMF